MKCTFDTLSSWAVGQKAGWQTVYEVAAVCRHCAKGTIYVLSLTRPEYEDIQEDYHIKDKNVSLNNYFNIERYVSVLDENIHEGPKYLPGDIETICREAATCISARCWNAAGAMFRLAIDRATQNLIPTEGQQPNKFEREKLGPRIKWLFEHKYIPDDLNQLATTIQQDGNDAAHIGNITEVEALDLMDFTYALFERLYTQPEKIRLAEARRIARRTPATDR
jgi:hypothetical protein